MHHNNPKDSVNGALSLHGNGEVKRCLFHLSRSRHFNVIKFEQVLERSATSAELQSLFPHYVFMGIVELKHQSHFSTL